MSITVCKFGGTSTASAGRLRRVLEIVNSDPARRYVVVSAPGRVDGQEKVTDLLSELWRRHVSGGNTSIIIDGIVSRYRALCEGLGLPDKDSVVLSELRRALTLSEAHTLSRGEYLCARVFAGFSGLPMADADGLIAFDRAGRLDEGRTFARFRQLKEMYPCAVIPGFYGADPDGHIVTFPRNGSDITGALAAAGLGANLYENWTDVPGVMTADPRLDPDARVLPTLRYADMQRMAARGAQVIHPDALAPVEKAGIPTRVKCTFEPDAAGTLIC